MIIINADRMAIFPFVDCLLKTLSKTYEVYINFRDKKASDLYIEQYGEIQTKYGYDLTYLILSSHQAKMFISFSGDALKTAFDDLKLYNFFNKINVPTVAIQHGLFQYGITLEKDPSATLCGNNGQLGLNVKMISDYVLTWNTNNAIGYPIIKESALETNFTNKQFNLIMTNLHWHIYDKKSRENVYNYLFDLIRKYSKEYFIWRLHPSEFQYWNYFVSKGFSLKNLKILNIDEHTKYQASTCIQKAQRTISTLSTTLVDLDFANKQTLVYGPSNLQYMLNQIDCESFENFYELSDKFNTAIHDKNFAKLNTHISEFDEKNFMRIINEILINSKYSNSWDLEAALNFIK